MHMMESLDQLVSFGRALSPFVVGAEGNISGRIPGGFFIKASGARLKNLTEEDLVGLNYDCTLFPRQSDKILPSMESSFHAWLYKNTGTQFIAHTHPVNTLSILCSRDIWTFAKYRFFPDQVVFNGKESCGVHYGHPGEDLTYIIAERVTSFTEAHGYTPKLILLQNHGIITLGQTIRECLIATEICEKAATVFLQSRSDGRDVNMVPLSSENVNKLDTDEREKYRRNIQA